jgi:hypothetical protein
VLPEIIARNALSHISLVARPVATGTLITTSIIIGGYDGAPTSVLDDRQLRRWLAAKQPVTRAAGDGLTFTLSQLSTATLGAALRPGQRGRQLTLGK